MMEGLPAEGFSRMMLCTTRADRALAPSLPAVPGRSPLGQVTHLDSNAPFRAPTGHSCVDKAKPLRHTLPNTEVFFLLPMAGS